MMRTVPIFYLRICRFIVNLYRKGWYAIECNLCKNVISNTYDMEVTFAFGYRTPHAPSLWNVYNFSIPKQTLRYIFNNKELK